MRTWTPKGRAWSRLAPVAVVAGAIALAIPSARAEDPEMAARFERAFSPIGRWTITKMEVVWEQGLGNVAGTERAGTATVNLHSSLGGDSWFEVEKDGSIKGEGTVRYNLLITGGATGLGGGIAGLAIPVPVGASAVLDAKNEPGTRKFDVTGRVDLLARTPTIKLGTFTPFGTGLKVLILSGPGPTQMMHPQANHIEFPAWPPMTKIDSDVLLHGASLLLQWAGKVGPFDVTFEAVKHVDLRELFATLARAGPATEPAPARPPSGSTPGPAGSTPPVDPPAADPPAGDRPSASPDPRTQAGVVEAAIGRVVSVTLPRPMASASYAVSLVPKGDASTRWLVSWSEKRADGFSIVVQNAGGPAPPLGARVSVDWIAQPYGAGR